MDFMDEMENEEEGRDFNDYLEMMEVDNENENEMDVCQNIIESQDIPHLSSTEAMDVDIETVSHTNLKFMDDSQNFRSWERPAIPPIDPRRDSIIFQQLEVDYVTQDGKPVIRMYGVTNHGCSVCCFVLDFQQYFYVKAPDSFTENMIPGLIKDLNKKMKSSGSNHTVTHIEVEIKASIWHYQFNVKKRFIKIFTTSPNTISTCKNLFENKSYHYEDCIFDELMTYESNLAYPLRFMIDCDISGGTWVEIPYGTYSFRLSQHKLSTCQIEIITKYQNVINHPPTGEYFKSAPLRILSVDIECAGRKGQFPEPQYDPVIQIASRVTILGGDTVINNILTLKECALIHGAEVMSFEKERDLLLRWQKLLRMSDPDVIIGYNICNFDLPYLVDRAKTLGILGEFEYWGRIRSSRIKMKDSQFSSRAYGTHEYKEISIEGRVQIDLMLTIQRDYKLSSYSLNSVSAIFLGEQKEDVHHSCITDLQNGTPETRRRLVVYCIKDAYLPQRLLEKLMYMYNYIEMARVTGVPFSYLLTRGQSIKVFSQILRKARNRDFIVPALKVGGAATGAAFEGATVLEAKQGFYEWPIATLDFASLYPSIMMAHNLCYTTLIPKTMINSLDPNDYEKSPSNDYFVRSSKIKGLLPEILEELLSARKRAKADLKEATDPFVKAVLDGRQLALKISANSVYGFTGATLAKLPCLQISSSVTSYGREMIYHTKALVTSMFTRSNGYEEDCEVIYGDTDSVMVKDVKRAMELGLKAAEEITKTFTPPVKLEFEKVYYPYLLMTKKRYAGLLWTRPDKHDKMDTKGIETVRRDNCILVRKVITTSLEKLLIDRDVDGAVAFVKQTISDLLLNKLDLSELVVSKGLSKEASAYENKSAHVELAKKMRKRDPATAPGIGDRVAYVIIKASKGAKAYEKAEDPIYALDHNLPIDFQHYVNHHLEQPLLRIFKPILKENVKDLLTGFHTRNIIISTPSANSGGIARFTKAQPRCLGCKAPLDKEFKTVCSKCKENEAEIYLDYLSQVNDLEEQYGRLWTQCQSCQGSLHQDVLCTNRDCPIFYRRKKVQKELDNNLKSLKKFDS